MYECIFLNITESDTKMLFHILWKNRINRLIFNIFTIKFHEYIEQPSYNDIIAQRNMSGRDNM